VPGVDETLLDRLEREVPDQLGIGRIGEHPSLEALEKPVTLGIDVADRNRRDGAALATEETLQVPPVLAQETGRRVLRMALDEDERARTSVLYGNCPRHLRRLDQIGVPVGLKEGRR
jgi:hypothetical protein